MYLQQLHIYWHLGVHVSVKTMLDVSTGYTGGNVVQDLSFWVVRNCS